MTHVFVDTNFFIDHKKYDAVPWDELLPGEELMIVILRSVTFELDKLKSSQTSRVARRAQKLTGLLRELRDGPISFQSNGRECFIGFADGGDTSIPQDRLIDLTNSDDCILNELLCWVKQNDIDRYIFLTSDVNITLRCVDCRIPFKDIPTSWRSATELDERDMEIMRLKQQLDSTPVLTITTPTPVVMVDVPLYSDVEDDKILQLTSGLFASFPMHTKFDNPHQVTSSVDNPRLSVFKEKDGWVYPTEADIEDYKLKYQKWQEECILIFKGSSRVLNNKVSYFYVVAELSNIGTAPAYDLEIQIEVSGGIYFLPTNFDKKKWMWGYTPLGIPAPPMPPKLKHSALDKSFYIGEGDPFKVAHKVDLFPDDLEINTVYAKYITDVPTTILNEYCKELRHGMGSCKTILDCYIPESGYGDELELTITVSARNLASPVVKKISINPTQTEGDLFSRLKKTVDDYTYKYTSNDQCHVDYYNKLYGIGIGTKFALDDKKPTIF